MSNVQQARSSFELAIKLRSQAQCNFTCAYNQSCCNYRLFERGFSAMDNLPIQQVYNAFYYLLFDISFKLHLFFFLMKINLMSFAIIDVCN